MNEGLETKIYGSQRATFQLPSQSVTPPLVSSKPSEAAHGQPSGTGPRRWGTPGMPSAGNSSPPAVVNDHRLSSRDNMGRGLIENSTKTLLIVYYCKVHAVCVFKFGRFPNSVAIKFSSKSYLKNHFPWKYPLIQKQFYEMYNICLAVS